MIIPLNFTSLIVSLLNKLILGFEESLEYLKNEVWINLFNTALKSSKLIIPSASISNFCIIFSDIFKSFSTSIEKKADRLTFVQSFYPEYVNYIFNAEDEYVKHGFFQKDENITNSGKYSYKWANQDQNTYIKLDQFLPDPDEKGYRDFTIYDSL